MSFVGPVAWVERAQLLLPSLLKRRFSTHCSRAKWESAVFVLTLLLALEIKQGVPFTRPVEVRVWVSRAL